MAGKPRTILQLRYIVYNQAGVRKYLVEEIYDLFWCFTLASLKKDLEFKYYMNTREKFYGYQDRFLRIRYPLLHLYFEVAILLSGGTLDELSPASDSAELKDPNQLYTGD